MTSPDLLITGATGFIGFKVLLDALVAGYKVRAAVRTSLKSDIITANPHIKTLSPGSNLSFVEVPDILASGAYDEALKGVTYVIHVASPLPLPSRDPEKDILQPATLGTSNLLASALKTPSVRRVIITSSIVSNMAYPPIAGETIVAESRVANPDGPFTEVFPAYCGSKIIALNATDTFMKENNPSFDVINILPGFVYGRNEKATNIAELFTGSNRLLLAILKGQTFEVPRLAGAVHIDDVAKVHVLALDKNIKGGQDFGATIPMVYDDVFEIVKKHFPAAIENGTFSQGHQPSLAVDWDASKTEKTFGFHFQSYEAMVVGLVGQYLELMAKAERENDR